MIKERRKIPRYLCSDDFSESRLMISSKVFKLVSINFNRYGIELYSYQQLPEFSDKQDCQISFEFQTKNRALQVERLTCRIKNRRETEVGHSYGFKVNNENVEDEEIFNKLIAIEKLLEQNNSSENRYGLFD